MRFLLAVLLALVALSFVAAIPTSYSKNQLNSILKQIQMKKDNTGDEWYGPQVEPAIILIREPYLY